MDDVTAWALRARDGDGVAAAAFVRATQADVWRLVAHLARPDVADDLTQDTYARAFRALGGYRGEAPIRAWLLSIARRTAADWVRSARRDRALAARLAGPRATEPDPAEAVALAALLDCLDPDRRTAFVATQVVGLSYEEAAAVCGCPVGTIRSRVARARAELAAALRNAGNSTVVSADQ